MARWMPESRSTQFGVALLVIAQPLVEVLKIASGLTVRPTASQIVLTGATAALVAILAVAAAMATPKKNAKLRPVIRGEVSRWGAKNRIMTPS